MSASFASAQAETKVELGPDGLHVQDWFFESSRVLASDLQSAASEGKNVVFLVEQRGCIYCKELHEVNFNKKETVDMMKAGYLVIQLDMWGEDPVTDLNGQIMTERDLVRKWGVTTTPTTIVVNTSIPNPHSLPEVEAFRLPGYLKTFQYHTALNYVASGAFEDMAFRDFMAQSTAALQSRGIDPDNW